MRIPLVDLREQYRRIRPEIDVAIQRVLDHTGFILGEEVNSFEQAFAVYAQVKGAVGVASGTAALRLALEACGVGPGDQVVTTAHTFIATAEAISHIGAVPVYVDIDPKTYTIDPNMVEDEIKKRKRTEASATNGRVSAIVPVHLYGHPADMDPIMEIAGRYGLQVVEDAAQAHGAEYKGRRCGSIGHLACFSFYPGKNLGAYGDAGMVSGNDEELLAKLRRQRDHGRISKYEHEEIGWGERLDALQAAILSAKLHHLEDWTNARRAHAASYSELLKDSPVETPRTASWARAVFHLYVVRSKTRDELLAHLKQKGIGVGIHYPIPLHRQPAYAKMGYGRESLPNTERAAAEVLSLPMYPELTPEQIALVADAVKGFEG